MSQSLSQSASHPARVHESGRQAVRSQSVIQPESERVSELAEPASKASKSVSQLVSQAVNSESVSQ